MIKVCKVKREEISKTYLKVLNGVLGLTEGELELTAAVSDLYQLHGSQGLREPYLSKFVFSTDERKKLETDLNLKSQGLSNKLNQLVTKGVLTKEEDTYRLNPELLPRNSVTFQFEIKDDEPSEAV